MLLSRGVPALRRTCPSLGAQVRHASEFKTSESAAYSGPGKTTMSIMNELTSLLMVDAISTNGFRLNNEMRCYGPIVIFPTCILSWSLRDYSELTADSLTVFKLIRPKPELVVVGYGAQEDFKMTKELYREVKKMGLNVEFLPTEHAVSTYNYLCSEHRLVGAALLPPNSLSYLTPHDKMDSGLLARDGDAFQLNEKDTNVPHSWETTKGPLLGIGNEPSANEDGKK